MCARPRIPTAIHVAQGKMQKGTPHAARFEAQGRGNEPVPTSPLSVEPPVHLHLTDTEMVCWKRAMEILPPGVAGCSDEIAMHMLVQLWAKQIIGTIQGPEYSHLRSLCVQFGMTPAARSKVVGTGPKRSDEGGGEPEDEFV